MIPHSRHIFCVATLLLASAGTVALPALAAGGPALTGIRIPDAVTPPGSNRSLDLLIRVQACEVDCGPEDPGGGTNEPGGGEEPGGGVEDPGGGEDPTGGGEDPEGGIEDPGEGEDPECCVETPGEGVQPAITPPPRQGITSAERQGRKDQPAGFAQLSPDNTRMIAQRIADVTDACGDSSYALYRVDCIRQHYIDLAAQLPKTGDYAPIRQALLAGAARLDAIVEANLDEGAPQIVTPALGKAGKKRPPLRAVRPDAAAAALAQAERVVEETAVLILRSGEDPARRTAHYQAIAEAVDSNLVILRSA